MSPRRPADDSKAEKAARRDAANKRAKEIGSAAKFRAAARKAADDLQAEQDEAAAKRDAAKRGEGGQ